ncbi:hypothetical protein B1R38_05230 [Bacillus cereus]|uniref:DUF1036 domain-containing protein n=1 Tax=Bacillus cereus TaxID=1396 RepID=UPI000D650590|nr:hypothetical protein B1R38_05230 [Bacillus cereus]
MPLKFKNDTNLMLWLTVAYWDPSCSGNKWRKEGWFRMPPGSTVTAWTGKTKDNDFFYFARDTNETIKWEENYYTDLPLGSMNFSNGLDYYFSRCWDEPVPETNRINRGMQLIRPTVEDATLELFLR